MKARKFAAALAVTLASGSAFAINKCIGTDGRPVFQDAPCSGKGEVLDVRPASGSAPAARPAASAGADMPSAGGVGTPPGARPQSEAERLESEIAKSQRARRKRDLEVVAIPNKRVAIAQHTAQCDRQQAQLQAKKRQANNNLAGAVWEQSISEEMSAAARECATRSRQLLSEMDSLRTECAAMNCVPEGQ